MTSEDAHVYLAYCNKNRNLEVFPPQHSIRTRAGEITFAPDRAADLVLDRNTGPEALYVIVSRVDISGLDQHIIKTAAAPNSASVAADCGPRKPPVLKHRPLVGHPAPLPPRENDTQGSSPLVSIERGWEVDWNGTSAINADAAGIVILRYGFTHVAAVSKR